MNLPAEWADAERVQLEFDPSCEAMIFDTEGCPLQGITGGGGIDRRVEFILPKEKRASGYKCALFSLSRPKCASPPVFSRRRLTTSPADYIEVSCNAMFGNGLFETNAPPDMNRFYTASRRLHHAPNSPFLVNLSD